MKPEITKIDWKRSAKRKRISRDRRAIRKAKDARYVWGK